MYNKTGEAVKWSSKDEGIATVNESGWVKGLAKGDTKIRVYSADSMYGDSITITVQKAEDLGEKLNHDWKRGFKTEGGVTALSSLSCILYNNSEFDIVLTKVTCYQDDEVLGYMNFNAKSGALNIGDSKTYSNDIPLEYEDESSSESESEDEGDSDDTKKDDDTQPLIEVETTIDDKYAKEEDLKIEIHKKINSIDSLDKLNQIKEEFEDRFGTLDENVIIYMYEELFEKQIKELNVKNVNQTKNFIAMTFNKDLSNKIDGENLFMDVLTLSRKFRFSMKNDELTITFDTVGLDKHFIYYLIDLIKIVKKDMKK